MSIMSNKVQGLGGQYPTCIKCRNIVIADGHFIKSPRGVVACYHNRCIPTISYNSITGERVVDTKAVEQDIQKAKEDMERDERIAKEKLRKKREEAQNKKE